MTHIGKIVLLFFSFLLCLHSCNTKKENHEIQAISSLKSKFLKDFYIGAAINDSQINETDLLAIQIIEKEFNTITPENIMKWMYLHPGPDTYYFDMADKYVALGEKHNMNLVGHTLVWHSQLGEWMNEVKDSAAVAGHLEDYINTVVGRYKGRIHTWDVVNEALNEDGTMRESIFFNSIGDRYIEYAFKWAAEADPEAELVYNDYNLWKPEKRAGVVRLVKQLQTSGAKIDGVGMQAHWSLIEPSLEDIENSIIAYAELGVKVMFTELDVTALPNPWDLEGAEVSQDYEKYEGDETLNPYPDNLPNSVQEKLAQRYEDIFKLFLKHEDKISRVTFWGVNDGQTWLNNWPIKGRMNHPLLFDREFRPKKAYHRVLDLKSRTKQ